MTHAMLAHVQWVLYSLIFSDHDWADTPLRRRLERIEDYLIRRLTR